MAQKLQFAGCWWRCGGGEGAGVMIHTVHRRVGSRATLLGWKGPKPGQGPQWTWCPCFPPLFLRHTHCVRWRPRWDVRLRLVHGLPPSLLHRLTTLTLLSGVQAFYLSGFASRVVRKGHWREECCGFWGHCKYGAERTGVIRTWNSLADMGKRRSEVRLGPGWRGSVDWAQAANQRVVGLIPGQGTCLGCGPGPQWGPHRDNHTLMFLSRAFSLPSPPPKNINKIFKKNKSGRTFDGPSGLCWAVDPSENGFLWIP